LTKHINLDSKNTKNILRELGVLQGEKLTNAGLLCFAANTNMFQNAVVKLARFKGDTPDVFIDMKNTSGNLIDAVNESLVFITRSINMKVEIGKQAERLERWI